MAFLWEGKLRRSNQFENFIVCLMLHNVASKLTLLLHEPFNPLLNLIFLDIVVIQRLVRFRLQVGRCN